MNHWCHSDHSRRRFVCSHWHWGAKPSRLHLLRRVKLFLLSGSPPACKKTFTLALNLQAFKALRCGLQECLARQLTGCLVIQFVTIVGCMEQLAELCLRQQTSYKHWSKASTTAQNRPPPQTRLVYLFYKALKHNFEYYGAKPVTIWTSERVAHFFQYR